MERRSLDCFVDTCEPSEVRAADPEGTDDGEALAIRGYAALFNTDSERMGWMVEQIDPRAFDDVLADMPDVRVLADHGGLPMARTSNGTLRLWTDDKGLRFEAKLNPGMQAARDLHAAIERGDMSQMSFGFRIGDEEAMGHSERCGDDCTLDHIRVTRVSDIFEISAVTFPAYRDTEVEARGDEFGVTHDAPAPGGSDSRAYRVALELAHGGATNGDRTPDQSAG